MGLVYAEIDLINGGDMYLYRQKLLDEKDVKQVRVKALVDSGAYNLCISETVQTQLDLPFIEKQFVTLADDTLIEVDFVGPVDIRFENRSTTVRALVLPGDSALGAEWDARTRYERVNAGEADAPLRVYRRLR